MKTRLWLSPIVTATLLTLSGCETASQPKTTVLAQPGGAAAAVTKNQEAEIIALKAQVVAVDEKTKEYLKIGAAAAGNVHGVLTAATHVEAGLPKEAVIAEATLAQDALALPSSAPAELVAAYSQSALEAERRVNLILTGQRDAARVAYESEKTATRTLRDAIVAKDAEIETSKAAVLKVEGEKVALVQAAKVELEANRKAQQSALDAKDEALVKYKAEVASKERKYWVNGIRVVCGALILIGVLAIALTKGEALIQGGIMAGCGVLGIFIAVGFDILTSQKWFPWAFGGVALLALGAGVMFMRHLFLTQVLYRKQSEAIQDAHDEAGMANDVTAETTAPFPAPITEAVEKRKAVWAELEKHLKFRMGGKDSSLGKELKKRLVARGLDTAAAPAK